MSAQEASEVEKSIQPGHAEQVRNVLSTIVDAEFADRNIDPDSDQSSTEVLDEIEPVEVTLEEIVRSCPVPEAKCRALLEDSASEPGTGIEIGDRPETYRVDPTA